MQLYTLLAKLPYTLVITSLALAASAVPVQSTELTVLNPSNFKETIKDGVWFIEHFSPYCGHCRRFAPTWTQLVEETEKQADPGIHLAQVNCAVDGDLCRENKVDGYPQMNLYKNGEFVEVFSQPRDLERLREYLAAHAEKKTVSPPVQPAVEEAPVIPRETYNPSGKVLVLNDKTFDETIRKGHVFVKFYAPWCGHCKKLAPIWTQLAHEMQGKVNVAELDCEAYGSVCRSQGVSGYPMLFYYGENGSGKTEYTGGRKLDQLKSFAEKVSGPAVQQLAPEHLDQEVRAHPVMYLLLHPASDTASVNQISKASHVLFGSPPVYTSSAPSLYDHFNLDSSRSAILALKDHDSSVPATWAYLDKFGGSTESLGKWLQHNKLPTFTELDADSFQEVMNAPHQPLVVLVAAPRAALHDAADRVKAIAQQWRDSKARGDVVFAWMDADKWASWLKSMYGVAADAAPAVVVASHSRLVYWDVDQFGSKIALSAKSIFSAVTGALNGTISYKHSENFVERMARYLNNQLIGVEHFVSNHPWGITFFVVAGVIAVALFIKRLLADESALADEHFRKARLD